VWLNHTAPTTHQWWLPTTPQNRHDRPRTTTTSPLSKSTNNEEHTHPQPSPTMIRSEYDHPQTTIADPLAMWDVHPNSPWTMTTHHTKQAQPPTNDTNCPPSRQNPGHPQMKPPITHESPPAMRSAHSNHPQTMTAHHNKKQARLVFESPVRSGYWVPRGSNRDQDWLGFVPEPKIT